MSALADPVVVVVLEYEKSVSNSSTFFRRTLKSQVISLMSIDGMLNSDTNGICTRSSTSRTVGGVADVSFSFLTNATSATRTSNCPDWSLQRD